MSSRLMAFVRFNDAIVVAEAGLDRGADEQPGGLERGVGGGDDTLPAPLAAKRAHDRAVVQQGGLPGDHIEPPHVCLPVGAVEYDVAKVIRRLLEVHGVCPNKKRQNRSLAFMASVSLPASISSPSGT